MNELELFMRTLMLEAGFKEEELFDDIVEDATEILADRLDTEIMMKLSEDDRDIFVEMVDQNQSRNQAYEFAAMKIKEYQSFMQNCMQKFRKEYLEEEKETSTF